MPPQFGTFDLGSVLANAEKIKGFQRQSRFQDLQEMAMKTNIAGAEQTQRLQQQQFDANAQRANTEKLHAGVLLAKQNPSVLPQLLDGLANDGIINPEAAPQILQLAQTDPQRFNAMLDDLGANLQYALSQPPEKPKETDDIAEYKFAQQQGFQGTLQEFITEQKRAGAVNVDARNMGTIPPGYKVEYDDQGNPTQMSAIPGGPAEKEQQEAERKVQQRQENIELAGGTVVQDLERGLAILETSNFATGPQAVVTKNIPGSPAWRLQQFVNSVASNIGIDRLQAMREASPTGGALGQIPVQQQLRLEQLLGSLAVEQPKEVLQDNMNRVQNIYLDIIHGTGNGPERKRLSFDENGRKVEGGAPWRGDPVIQQAESGIPETPAPGTVDGGYLFLGGDPSKQENWLKQ